MRAAHRITVWIVALLLLVVVAMPASAAQIIRYQGETSLPTPNRISFQVLKRDNGQRFLTRLSIHFTLTCEDASTRKWGNGIAWYGRSLRLGTAGEFSWEFDYVGPDYIAIDGTIGFRHASGTATAAQALLTDDHTDSQVCTTGGITWTAERTDARPARTRTTARVPEGMRFTRISVIDGVAVIER